MTTGAICYYYTREGMQIEGEQMCVHVMQSYLISGIDKYECFEVGLRESFKQERRKKKGTQTNE